MGKKKKDEEENSSDKTLILSLKCPSCEWEWSEYIDCSTPYLSAQCPSCSHNPIYLISLYG